MPLRLSPIFAVLLIAHVGCAQRKAHAPPPAAQAVSVESLREHPPIGRLGVPLGTCVEIRATVVTLDMKSMADTYMLRVTHVNGTPLAEPAVMEFSNANTGVEQPLERGRERAHLGKQLRLVVYETGGYSGIPDLPEGIGDWQGRRFGFGMDLVVLAERR